MPVTCFDRHTFKGVSGKYRDSNSPSPRKRFLNGWHDRFQNLQAKITMLDGLALQDVTRRLMLIGERTPAQFPHYTLGTNR